MLDFLPHFSIGCLYRVRAGIADVDTVIPSGWQIGAITNKNKKVK